MDTVKKLNRHERYDGPACPVAATLELIDGKWKGSILFHLLGGTLRFNELRRLMCNVSHRVITKQLRDLEEAGLVHREVYPEVPPRVEYSLTPLGRSLEPVIRSLEDWGADLLGRDRPISSERAAE